MPVMCSEQCLARSKCPVNGSSSFTLHTFLSTYSAPTVTSSGHAQGRRVHQLMWDKGRNLQCSRIGARAAEVPVALETGRVWLPGVLQQPLSKAMQTGDLSSGNNNWGGHCVQSLARPVTAACSREYSRAVREPRYEQHPPLRSWGPMGCVCKGASTAWMQSVDQRDQTYYYPGY